MTSSSAASLLSDVTLAPRDPILGVTEAFNADPNPRKVNLGVGVYTDDAGKVPVLECVRRAELQMAEDAVPRNYLPIDGLKTYDRAVQDVLLQKQQRTLAAYAQSLKATLPITVRRELL